MNITTELTNQRVGSMIAKAGFERSSTGSDRIGNSTRMTGFSVETLGEFVATCRRCGRHVSRIGHSPQCIKTKGATTWRTAIVGDGSFAVEYHYRVTLAATPERVDELRESATATTDQCASMFENAGLVVNRVGPFKFIVSEERSNV